MNIRNSFAILSYVFRMSANKLSYEKFTKESRKNYVIVIGDNYDLIYCQRLGRSATGRMAAYQVGTRRPYRSRLNGVNENVLCKPPAKAEKSSI